MKDDSRDYYDRKTKHREEILPLLGWLWASCIVFFLFWTIFT